jgi:hypothetical protein
VNVSDKALAQGLGFMVVLVMLGAAGFVPGNAAVALLAMALGTGAVLLVVTVPPGTGFGRRFFHKRGGRGTRSSSGESSGEWSDGAVAPAYVDPAQDAAPADDGVYADASDYADAVAVLDDSELCAAWRVSRDALLLTELPERASKLVALRQAYLDEMEHRHPRGFASE